MNGVSESEESATLRSSDELGFDASVLLSEPHAVCQDAQRAVRELQERLALMVQQHSRAQSQHGDENTHAAEESADTGETPGERSRAGKR